MKSQIKFLFHDYVLRSVIIAMVVAFVAITGITRNNYDARSITAIMTFFKQYFSVIMLGNGVFLSVFLGKEYESGTIYQLYILEGKMKFWINKIIIGTLFVLVIQGFMFFFI